MNTLPKKREVGKEAWRSREIDGKRTYGSGNERKREREGGRKQPQRQRRISGSLFLHIPFALASWLFGKRDGICSPGGCGKTKAGTKKRRQKWNRVMRPVIAGMSWRGGWKGAINDRVLMNSCLYAFDRVLSDTAFAYTQYQSR